MVLNLKCKECLTNYQKPEAYKEWNEKYPNVFFKYSLMYCDFCRKKIQDEHLEKLPLILDLLTKEIK